jgi:hypothetical protein
MANCLAHRKMSIVVGVVVFLVLGYAMLSTTPTLSNRYQAMK